MTLVCGCADFSTAKGGCHCAEAEQYETLRQQRHSWTHDEIVLAVMDILTSVHGLQEIAQLKQAWALEKQTNAELTESIRRHRRAAAHQDAEAAGREHKYKNEIQELKKASLSNPITPCACRQSTLVSYASKRRIP